jgi:pentose-5-phosphate-3-epimerase
MEPSEVGDLEPRAARFELLGPFTSHEVIVNGRMVPHLTASPMNGGMIAVTLDGRYDLHLTVEEADKVIPFLADCIAVGAGYTCHPAEGAEPQRLSPFPNVSDGTGF